MNQRRGRVSRHMDGPGINAMQLCKFIVVIKEQLQEAGYEDPAFYFEQVETYFRNGGLVTTDPKKVSSLLGL